MYFDFQDVRSCLKHPDSGRIQGQHQKTDTFPN